MGFAEGHTLCEGGIPRKVPASIHRDLVIERSASSVEMYA